uniref:Uncharacterized protein n=1 Tax=Arundo donax TaxID=35708 RepID=A0A0A9EPA9_ARUDO
MQQSGFIRPRRPAAMRIGAAPCSSGECPAPPQPLPPPPRVREAMEIAAAAAVAVAVRAEH